MQIRMLAVLIILIIPCIVFAQTGTLIVLNKSDHTASLIDVASGKVRATVPTGTAPHEVTVSPDGGTAVVANYGTGQSPGNTLTVIDLQRKKRSRDIDLGEFRRPHGVEWLGDDQVIVTVEANKAVLLVNVRDGTIARKYSTDQQVSHMVAVSRDRTKAFVPNIGSGTCTVIDLKSGKILRQVETGAGAEGIDVTPDGREVWVTNRSANTVSVINVASLNVVETLSSASFPIRLKFTPDGAFALVSNAQSGDVAVFDVKKRNEVTRISMEFSPANDADQRLFGDRFGTSPVPVGILIDPSGKRAYVANTQADVVTVIDLKEWRVVDRLVAGKEPDGMAFSQQQLAE